MMPKQEDRKPSKHKEIQNTNKKKQERKQKEKK